MPHSGREDAQTSTKLAAAKSRIEYSMRIMPPYQHSRDAILQPRARKTVSEGLKIGNGRIESLNPQPSTMTETNTSTNPSPNFSVFDAFLHFSYAKSCPASLTFLLSGRGKEGSKGRKP